MGTVLLKKEFKERPAFGDLPLRECFRFADETNGIFIYMKISPHAHDNAIVLASDGIQPEVTTLDISRFRTVIPVEVSVGWRDD